MFGWMKSQSESESQRVAASHMSTLIRRHGGRRANEIAMGYLSDGMTPLQEASALGRAVAFTAPPVEVDEEYNCLSDVGRDAAGFGGW